MKSERRSEKQRERMQLFRKIDPTGDARAALAAHEKERRKRTVVLAAATMVLAAVSVFSGEQMLLEGGILRRNGSGEGSYEVSLIASVGGTQIETQITVEEQTLTGEALQELFDAAAAELLETMLGENESVDYVIYDLTLPDQTQDGRIEAQWSFDNHQVISSDGSIQDDISEDGALVEVTLTMTYQTQSAESIFSICVYPPAVSEEQLLAAALSEAIEEADAQSEADAELVLPDEVNGETVSWSEPEDGITLKVLLIGFLLIIILQYEEDEKLKRACARRDERMAADYAGIVNKLSLLMGAGMTVYGAWERITAGYVESLRHAEEKAGGWFGCAGTDAGAGRRPAYEEMLITSAQIRSGAGEAGAYEAFGRRCGLRQYMKLSAILSQNLKLGTAGVTQQLNAEAAEASEQRMTLARRKGEEAGTRLLLPMMMLLVVVMAITAVPGFLSM